MPVDTADTVRARYLRDRVMTASPMQRVVMLYDRLGLDIGRACTIDDSALASQHLGHAMQVVAELRSCLDLTAGGPAENLAALYGFLLREIAAAQCGDTARLQPVQGMISTLRDAWAQVDAEVSGSAATERVATGSWTG